MILFQVHVDCGSAEKEMRLTVLEWLPCLLSKNVQHVLWSCREASKLLSGAVTDVTDVTDETRKRAEELLQAAMILVNAASTVAPFILPVGCLKFEKRWNFELEMVAQEQGISVLYPYISVKIVCRLIVFPASARAHGTLLELNNQELLLNRCCHGLAPAWLAGELQEEGKANSKREHHHTLTTCSSSNTFLTWEQLGTLSIGTKVKYSMTMGGDLYGGEVGETVYTFLGEKMIQVNDDLGDESIMVTQQRLKLECVKVYLK